MRTLKQLAAEAIMVQNACNILGVTNSMHKALCDLRDALGALNLPAGSQDIAFHPITRLWASKVHDLACMGLSDSDRFSTALHECQQLADKE